MKAALYLRVSTDDQTVSNQRQVLEGVCEREKWMVVDVFSDTVSGAKSSRPALDDMLSRLGGFDIIVCWAIDRLGRSLLHLQTVADLIHDAGVNLYFHQQQIDTSTPQGRLFFQMCGAFAEFERAMISERTKAGLARVKAEGKQLGGGDTSNAVAANVSNADQHAIATLPYIQQAEQWGAVSYSQIAEALTARGIPTRTGGKWHASSVRNIKQRCLAASS